METFLNKLKQWKPIHLCWLFRKFGLPIPPYFIGAANQVLDQRNYNIGDDDNADPDLCTWDGNSTPRVGQAKEVNFMVRLQVANDGTGDAAPGNWQLYYNTVDDEDTAIQVTTISGVVAITNGTPNDQVNCNSLVCSDQAEEWSDGIFTDASDESGERDLDQAHFTEYQFCVQFDTTAGGKIDYYFYLFFNGAKLNGTYDNVAKVTTAAIDISPDDVSSASEIVLSLQIIRIFNFNDLDGGFFIDSIERMDDSETDRMNDSATERMWTPGYNSGSLETEVIDVGAIVTGALYLDLISTDFLGAEYLIEYKTSTNGSDYTSYAVFVNGVSVNFRYIIFKITLIVDRSNYLQNNIKITGLYFSVDLPTIINEYVNQTIDVGGTVITFAKPYTTAASIGAEITPLSAVALIPTYDTVTKTTLKIYLFDKDGVDVGGTAGKIKITGF